MYHRLRHTVTYKQNDVLGLARVLARLANGPVSDSLLSLVILQSGSVFPGCIQRELGEIMSPLKGVKYCKPTLR